MRQILKYTMMPGDTLVLPPGLRAIHVHEQHGAIRVWAQGGMIEPPYPLAISNGPGRDRITAWETGEMIPDAAGEYLGTVHLRDAELVFHLYRAFEMGAQ